MLLLKNLENQDQTKPEPSRQKEIIKVKAEINELETKKQDKESMNLRDSFFLFL